VRGKAKKNPPPLNLLPSGEEKKKKKGERVTDWNPEKVEGIG
jgi:hypothetical protein